LTGKFLFGTNVSHNGVLHGVEFLTGVGTLRWIELARKYNNRIIIIIIVSIFNVAGE